MSTGLSTAWESSVRVVPAKRRRQSFRLQLRKAPPPPPAPAPRRELAVSPSDFLYDAPEDELLDQAPADYKPSSFAELLDTDVVVLLKLALRRQRRAAGSTIEILTAQAREQRDLVGRLTASLAAANKQLAGMKAVQADSFRWRSEADQLRAAVRAAESEARSARADLTALQGELARVEQELADRRAELLIAQADRQRAITELELGREHVARLTTELTDARRLGVTPPG